MKTFIKFLLCTLFLCVQSSQAYVISAALWRFNENAGTDADTEVLVLGDLHRNVPIGSEHAKAILKKVDKWNDHEDATHFIMEEFPQYPSEKQLKMIVGGSTPYDACLIDSGEDIRACRPYSDFQTIDQIRRYIREWEQAYSPNYAPKVMFNCADYRNYSYSFMRWFLKLCDVEQPVRQSSMSKFYCISLDLDLKYCIETMHQKTCERIQQMKEDIGLGARKTIEVEDVYIDEITRLIKELFVKTVHTVQISNDDGSFGRGLYVKELEAKSFSDLWCGKFLHYSGRCADLGFLLEFIKHKSEYKRHIFFVGARHAAVINALMEKYKENNQIEDILKIGPCNINDWYAKWPYEKKQDYPATPIETQKLTNILNLAFTGVAKKDIGSLF